MSRRRLGYASRRNDTELVARLKDLALSHPRYGCRLLWAYDFVEDRTETGRKLRILTIQDEFTRECVDLEVEYRMNARFVAGTLLRLFGGRGVPEFIRSDNGSEFIARELMAVLKRSGVTPRHIDPGSPWQNGLNERLNGTLREECLNLETFHNRNHARALVKRWGRGYNQDRPHRFTSARAASRCRRS